MIRELWQVVAARYRAWRKYRYWNGHRRWEHLAQLIRDDHRWMAHDKTADVLTERYLRAMRDDWYTLDHENVGQVRTRLNLDPDYRGSNGHS